MIVIIPLIAAIVLGLVAAQIVFPTATFYHTEAYAVALAVAIGVLGYEAYKMARRNEASTRRRAVALGGVVAIGLAGFASGLLGPDTQVLSRTPGTVAPLPQLGIAAFFPLAGPQALARADTGIVLRRRNGPETDVRLGGRAVIGATLFAAQARTVAFVDVADATGAHLTMTQPANPSFLSPVLFFSQRIEVAGKNLPSDSFAVPAKNRTVKAVLLTQGDARSLDVHHAGGDAVLFVVDDEQGRPVPDGIAISANGKAVSIGGLRVAATLGKYPQLIVAATPLPIVLWLGALAIVVGLIPFGRPKAWRLALSLTLCACTRVDTAGGAAGGALHPWTHPDTLRVGAYEEPDSLNPAITSMAFAGDVFQLLYDGLVRYDDRGRAVPDLASAVPTRANGGISADGRTIVYHLVRNAHWSDGVALTSADVAFTFRALMNPANLVPTRVGYDRIASIETPDANTVRVRLHAPYAPAVYLFRDLNQGAILPAHLLARYPDLNRIPFNARPVGSGPYVLRSWEHGNAMRFDANPHYFRGPPKIPHVVFAFINDQNTLLAQLRAHEIDIAYDLPPYAAAQVTKFAGVALSTTSTLHWEHLAFNVRSPPLDDRRVRLALAYGIDERAIFSSVYFGLGTPGPTDQNPDFGWSDPRLTYYPHDVARAGALLAAAGWIMGPDGLRHKNGRPLTLMISTVAGVKNRESIEVLLQSMWRALGVDLAIKNAPAPTLFAPAGAGGLLYGGKTQISLFAWDNQTPDPDDESTLGPNRLPPDGQNVSFYRDPQIGRDQQSALASYDVAFRRRRYLDVQRILLAQVPEYTLDWLPEIDAANSDLRGLRPVPVGSDFWNVADWTFGARSK